MKKISRTGCKTPVPQTIDDVEAIGEGNDSCQCTIDETIPEKAADTRGGPERLRSEEPVKRTLAANRLEESGAQNASKRRLCWMPQRCNWFFKLIVLIAAFACVFILGLNSKKMVVSLKKKWAPKAVENVFPVLEHKPFVVVVPSYNNEKWVEKNLGSILKQKYDNFRIIYINDASTDGTKATVELFFQEHARGIPYDLWNNLHNLGASENIYRAVMSCEHDEIIVMVDGDDWLAHDHVLERLNEVYADPDVWMTCGNHLQYIPYTFIKADAAGEIPKEVLESNSLRSYVQVKYPLSHLKTFYTALFKMVKFEDFQIDGHFFDCTSDVAMMVPMAEMAGSHYRHIRDILYIYNHVSPMNDDKVRYARQQECMRNICSRSAYHPLANLPINAEEELLVKQ